MDTESAPHGESTSTPLRSSRTWLLTVTCMCVLLVISAMIALNTALGDIARDTWATSAQLTWIVDAYTLALACLLLLGGTLGDRYGRRAALIAGLVTFGASSLIPVQFDSPTGIIVGGAAAGVGAAFVLPATLSLLTGAYQREERNKAIGVWAGVAGAGAIVGFLGAGLLLEVATWRAVFWAFAIASLGLALAAGLLWMRYITVDANYWNLLWPMIVMSSGIGVCTAPATVAITAAVPNEKQGVASAVNDAGSEVGAAIGIAVTGSVLAAQYGQAIKPLLGGFPDLIRAQATESLPRALAVAESLGPLGNQLQVAAKTAFVEAMSATAAVLSAVVASSAFIIGIWAPGRDGRQLKILQKLTRTKTQGRHHRSRPRSHAAPALPIAKAPSGEIA